MLDVQATAEVAMTTPLQKPDAEVFIDFHYAELKDLGNQFLVVDSAVLAFSVTFSEKVTGLAGPARLQALLLLAGWTCLVLALIAAGSGLYYNYVAGAQAKGAIIRGKPSDFKPLVRRTYLLYHLAGGAFVVALVLLVVVGALKIL